MEFLGRVLGQMELTLNVVPIAIIIALVIIIFFSRKRQRPQIEEDTETWMNEGIKKSPPFEKSQIKDMRVRGTSKTHPFNKT